MNYNRSICNDGLEYLWFHIYFNNNVIAFIVVVSWYNWLFFGMKLRESTLIFWKIKNQWRRHFTVYFWKKKIWRIWTSINHAFHLIHGNSILYFQKIIPCLDYLPFPIWFTCYRSQLCSQMPPKSTSGNENIHSISYICWCEYIRAFVQVLWFHANIGVNRIEIWPCLE